MPRPIALSRQVKPIENPALTIVEQACKYMLARPKAVALLTHWQHAARLSMTLRERPSARAIADFTQQMELALMLSWRLNLTADKRPPV